MDGVFRGNGTGRPVLKQGHVWYFLLSWPYEIHAGVSICSYTFFLNEGSYPSLIGELIPRLTW